MAFKPLLSDIFHVGYVVRDVEAATVAIGKLFGIANWLIVPLPPESPATALAYAYTGNLLIEMVAVDPNGEVASIHRGWIPDDPSGARLNHIAYLVENEDAVQAIADRYEARGIATAVRGAFGEIFSDYYYADTVVQLGHYTEYACLGPAGPDFLAGVPRN